jgi:hypothetical protein
MAVLTAGCGGGGQTSSAPAVLAPVSAAATKTQNAGASRIRFSMAFSGPQGKSFRMRGVGAIDGTSAVMSFKLGSMLGGLGARPALLKLLGHTSMKEVMLKQDGDFVIYLRLGFLSSQIPGGKQWLKLDFSKLGGSAGADLNKLLSGSQFEPSDFLSMLKSEGATIHKVGPDKVDGSATTRYHVTVDLAKAVRSKGLSSPLFSGAAAQMKTAAEDVWIGRNGLVRRIRTSYGMASAHVAMTMDLYDYGAHVSIAAPPGSDVFDATQFAQEGLGSALH